MLKPITTWKDKKHYLDLIHDKWYITLIEIENMINTYTVKFYEEKGIKTLHLPVTTSSISSPMGLGSDSKPVKINLFGIDTYLVDSMQFMLEYACRMFSNGAYYIMPSFRGEEADKRHLCQFYHSEAEIPGKLEDVMALVEEYIKYLCEIILEKYKTQVEQISGEVKHVEMMVKKCGNIPKIEFDEAAKMLENNPKYIETKQEGYRDITREGEKKILQMMGGVVWITHYDYIAVPFYQKFDNTKKKALNADLLFGIGETVGAGERHNNIMELEEALEIHKVDKKDYKWYYDMKKYYPIQTSGFGMGIERFRFWRFKHDDIRDCQILPRFNGKNMIP